MIFCIFNQQKLVTDESSAYYGDCMFIWLIRLPLSAILHHTLLHHYHLTSCPACQLKLSVMITSSNYCHRYWSVVFACFTVSHRYLSLHICLLRSSKLYLLCSFTSFYCGYELLQWWKKIVRVWWEWRPDCVNTSVLRQRTATAADNVFDVVHDHILGC